MGWSAQYFTTIIITGSSPQTGIFIYNGAPAPGSLIGSWANQAGTDAFGNAYPAGLNVTQGVLTGVTITNSQIINAILSSPTITAPTITQGTMQGTTITESTITFDSIGGLLLCYSSSTTTVTFSTSGPGNWTVPAGVVVGKVETWGADAAGGGGNTVSGGEAGGGAAYSCEPNYSFAGKTTIPYNIGDGGNAATTNNAGTGGGQTSFDGQGVVANGGNNGSAGVGGTGGPISGNTISFPGGNGGSNPSNFTSSAGGGGRAGSTGAGGNGGNPTANATPGTAGAAGTGVGGLPGGVGVLAGVNGVVGGGGSGAGKGSAGTTYISKFYDPTSTDSYYGSGVGQGLHDHNGNMFQGCPNSGLNSFPGDEFSYANYNHSQIASDFSGATIDSVQLTINNLHSWYNSGNYLILSYSDGGGDHYTGKYYWTPEGQTANIDASAPLNSQIKTLVAIKLGPSALTGNATSLYNYGYYQGGAGVGGPRLTVKGHVGTTGIFTSGPGANGVLKITYSTPTSLLSAIAPAAGTDANGNAYGAGYTGQVQAFHPGSAPTTVEGWQAISSVGGPGGTVNFCRVKRLAQNNMCHISISITGFTALAAQTSFTIGSLPATPVGSAGYYPTAQINLPIGIGGTATGVPQMRILIPASGAIQLVNLPAGTSSVFVEVDYPTD